MISLSRHAAVVVAIVVSAACRGLDLPTPSPTAPGATPSAQNSADAAATYTLEDLGSLSTLPSSQGLSINANGDVAGYVSDPNHPITHPALWIGQTLIDLGVPSGLYPLAIATDVNDVGTVLGRDLSSQTSSFLWKGGAFTIIPKRIASHALRASSLNNHDVVTGDISRGFGPIHAFRYAGGTVVDIHPAGYRQSSGTAISDEGEIVGWVEWINGAVHAARWSADNTFKDLESLSGNSTMANAVNNAGVIAGGGRTATTFVPFVWRASTGLVVVGPPGAANGISDRGRIAGYSLVAAGHVATTRTGTTPLTFLPLLPGTTQSVATAVNRCGAIAGYVISGADFRAVRWNVSACD